MILFLFFTFLVDNLLLTTRIYTYKNEQNFSKICLKSFIFVNVTVLPLSQIPDIFSHELNLIPKLGAQTQDDCYQPTQHKKVSEP